MLTDAQNAECRQAIALLENVNGLAVLADKGYDTNELRGRGVKKQSLIWGCTDLPQCFCG
jgi:IS5 family transposase